MKMHTPDVRLLLEYRGKKSKKSLQCAFTVFPSLLCDARDVQMHLHVVCAACQQLVKHVSSWFSSDCCPLRGMLSGVPAAVAYQASFTSFS
jgi:hypothetical protein